MSMLTQDQVFQMELACQEMKDREGGPFVAFMPSTMEQVLRSYWSAMEALQALYNARPFEPDARKNAEMLLREAGWRDPLAEEMN